MQAHKLDTRPDREIDASYTRVWSEDARWPRSSRLAFVLAAAAICWAVPLVIAYLLVS